jgi:GWxTD domain-containing protein
MDIRKFLVTTFLVATTAGSAFAALSQKYNDWAKSPAQFLMTKEEQAKWKTLQTDAEAEAFVNLFWARRDPTPDTMRNEFREDFDMRVKYADERFTSGRTKGSLSDRGRVFIVFGPPTRIERHRQGQDTPSASGAAGTSSTGSGHDTLAGGDRELFIYEKDSARAFGLGEARVTFVDQFQTGDYRLARTNSVDITGLTPVVIQTAIKSPGMTAAPTAQAQATAAPAPAAAPVVLTPTAVTAAPTTSLRTAAFQSAVADAKAGKNGLKKGYVSAAQLVSPSGEFYVPVAIYVPKSAGLIADSADTLFGAVEDANGTAVAAFEEPAKPYISKDDLVADHTLDLPSGKYKMYMGLAKGGQPVALATDTVDVTSIAKGAAGLSPIVLSEDMHETPEAALAKAPYAFGRLKIVPRGDATFTNRSEIGYLVELHNPGIDTATNQPKVQVKIELAGKGQPISAPLTEMPTLPISGAPGPGEYLIFNTIPLGQMKTALEPGDYTLKLKVIDMVTKQSYNSERKLTLTK